MDEKMAQLNEQLGEFINEMSPAPMFGSGTFAFTQYTFWLCIAIIVFVWVIFAARKRANIVPEGRFYNMIEALIGWFRRDIGYGVVGRSAEKHLPFLLTLGLLILTCNLIGLIPGCRPGTGTFSVTFALSLIVFVYFNVYGAKVQGTWHYIKALAPKGVSFPLNIFIWLIELLSLLLRLFTLAVRLFANMYAGHIVMGAFAVLTTIFVMPAITSFSVGNLLGALPALAWMLLLFLMYALELLIAFIQAYVFTVLSAVYISLAEGEH